MATTQIKIEPKIARRLNLVRAHEIRPLKITIPASTIRRRVAEYYDRYIPRGRESDRTEWVDGFISGGHVWMDENSGFVQIRNERYTEKNHQTGEERFGEIALGLIADFA
jgi:hypothetical protein